MYTGLPLFLRANGIAMYIEKLIWWFLILRKSPHHYSFSRDEEREIRSRLLTFREDQNKKQIQSKAIKLKAHFRNRKYGPLRSVIARINFKVFISSFMFKAPFIDHICHKLFDKYNEWPEFPRIVSPNLCLLGNIYYNFIWGISDTVSEKKYQN